MNSPTKNFLSICVTAGMNEEKANGLWLEIWSKSVSRFLEWLIDEGHLSSDQVSKLSTVFKSVKEQGSQGRNVFDWILPLITEEQKALSSQKFAEILVENLNDFYENILNVSSNETRAKLKEHLK